MKLSEKHLAVIRVGNIGRILFERLRAAGVPADRLVVCDSDPARAGAYYSMEQAGIRPIVTDLTNIDEAVLAAANGTLVNHESQGKTALMHKAVCLLVLLTALFTPTLIYAQSATPQPVVNAVLFWMNGCPHCLHMLEDVLPPLQDKYGSQLQIQFIEVVTIEDLNHLYEVATSYGIPKERVVVPFLIIGERVLIGSAQIPAELPGLIKQYLVQGGVDWPQGLAPQPAGTAIPMGTSGGAASGAVVHAILFTTLDCHSCQLETGAALTPVLEKYGAQFEYRTIDIVTSEDVEYLYQVLAGYGIPREQVDLPLLIIGNDVLIGEQMAAELPGLVEGYLSVGGVETPALPSRFIPPTLTSPSNEPSPTLANTPPAPAVTKRDNGFALAIVVLIGISLALVYAIGRLIFSLLKNSLVVSPSAWQDWIVPILCVIGLGVAGYLSYIEVRLSQAACGPVGDCNAVQASRYARLWGFLPVGVLGAFGYIAILAAWWVGREKWGWVSSYAPIALFGMAFFGTIFSTYLTYLEPFVIKAVCMWCITSAIIITLLLLLSLNPALRALRLESDDADET